MTEKETSLTGAVIGLNVPYRIVFPKIFPERSNYLDHLMSEDIASKVRLTQDEIKRFDFREDHDPESPTNGMFVWKEGGDKPVDIEFTSAELEWLKGRVKEMDDSKTIPRELFPVCRKIREAT